MKRTDACPDADLLGRTLSGEATEEELARLAAHLDACEPCRRAADRLAGHAALEDDLHWAARVRATTTVSVDESLRRLNAVLVDYELISEIGRGGMGIVYKAIQPKLNRQVAIKVLPALMGVVRPEAKARFRREAELAASLDHTNIISIHDYGEADGTLFYAMQLIRGRSLRDVLDEIEQTGAVDCVVGESSDPDRSRRTGDGPGAGRLYYRRVAQWIAEVADALQYAHEHGVMHRDIKPANLLLTEDGKLMISDFGLARAAQAHALTRTSSLIGTCRYMAPEQLDPERGEPDHRVDVYALGATLYELLAFRPMFNAPDDRQVMHQIASREPPEPHRVVRTVPRELETICLKAIQKAPGARYPSAGAFADDLRRWLLDLPIGARRGSVATRAARFARRHRAACALAGASLALAGACGVFWIKYERASAATAAARLDEAAQRTSALLGRAETLLRDERYDDALAILDGALGADPPAPGAVHLKAIALTRTGRTDEARALLAPAVERDPADWRSCYLLGMLTHGSHTPAGVAMRARDADVDVAVRRSATIGALLAEVERLHPRSPEALCLRSCVEPDHARAIELLDRALDLDPAFTDAMIEKAVRLGCMDRFADSLELLDAAIAADRGGHRVHGLRGIALYRLGRWGESEAAFTDAIARNSREVDWWYDRAAARTYSGNLAGAVDDATRAIELNPDYAFAYVARGRAYAGLARPAEATADYDRAAALDPGNADVYAERGLLRWQAGRYDQSLADANRLIELDPAHTRGYQRRAQTYLRLGRYGDALADLDTCDRIDPDDYATPTVRGGVLLEAGRPTEAAAAFEAGERLRPELYGNYHLQAVALIRAGRPAAALAPLTSWIALADNKDLARMRRGMVYEALGQPDLALADYRAAETSGTLGCYPSLWAGIAHALGGQRAEADACWSRCDAPPGSWGAALLGAVRGVPPDLAGATSAQRVEAAYYLGVGAMLAGDPPAAREFFRTCAAAGLPDTFEVDFARLRLGVLAEKDLTPP